MSLDMDSKILEIKNISEVTKWAIRDIIRCCKGERKSRTGYKWKYKDK